MTATTPDAIEIVSATSLTTDAADAGASIVSDDPTIAFYDTTDFSIHALSEGAATVTATFSNGDTAVYHVTSYLEYPQPRTGIISENNVHLLKWGGWGNTDTVTAKDWGGNEVTTTRSVKINKFPVPNSVASDFFDWNEDEGYYISKDFTNQELKDMPIQYWGGYNHYYDRIFELGDTFTINDYISHVRFKAKFKAARNGGKTTNWLIEGWKGNYANMGLGGEIGLYYNDLEANKHYISALPADWKEMQFALYENDESNKPWLEYHHPHHFWLAVFNPRVKPSPKPDTIIMKDGYIEFSDATLAKKFYKYITTTAGKKEKLNADKEVTYVPGSTRVNIIGWK